MKNFLTVLFLTNLSISVFGQVGVKFDNEESTSFDASMKSADFTHLLWDRNDNGDGYFITGTKPMFMYWDDDEDKIGYLIDTQNMTELQASFHSLNLSNGLISIGNVGIGTSNPTNGLLHIYNNATTGGFGSIVTSNAGLRIQDSQSSMYLDGNSLFSNGNLNIGTYNSNYIVFGTNDVVRLKILDNGLVGIGTSAPEYLMHVRGNPIDDPNFGNRQILGYFEQQAVSSREAGIAIKGSKYSSTSTVSYVDLDIHDNDETATDFTMARVGAGKESPTGINGQLRFFTNNNNTLTEQMRIKANGDVGIGTTSPDAKLTVKGDIHAERVWVELISEAPDYVFEDDYNLRSLEETASYIKANKHLPEVPSAKELAAEGVDLVEMNMLLLKKVEELTLHQINMQKEINQLRTQMNSGK